MSIVNLKALKQAGCELWYTGSSASSNLPKTVTPAGSVTQVLPFSGAGIGMFDGTGDYISTDTIDLSSGDFTIETHVYITKAWVSNEYQSLFSIYYDVNNQIIFPIYDLSSPSGNHELMFSTRVGGTWTARGEFNVSSQLSLNAWCHVALVKNGQLYSFYVNGLLMGSISVATAMPTNTAVIRIGSLNGTEWFFKGYLSEFRISNVARYTSNFTPPRKQLESDSNTKLLLHFLGSGNTFVDSSSSPKTITAYGDAKQLSSPCGSGVVYFDGNGDYLTISNNTDFNFIHAFSSSFTIQMKVYIDPNPTSNYPILIHTNNASGSNNGFSIWIDSNKFGFGFSNGSGSANYTDTTVITSGIFYDVTLVGISSTKTVYFYINGVLSTSHDYSAFSFSTGNNYGFRIGSYNGSSQEFKGYLSEYQVSNIARYTTAFTPSTQPFKPDPYTKLLLHFDGVGQAFYDSSDPPGDNGFPILPDGVTVAGTVPTTLQKCKDGRNVLGWNGSSNFISLDNQYTTLYPFDVDFTLCAWIRIPANVVIFPIYGQLKPATSEYAIWYLDATTSAPRIIIVSDTSGSVRRFYYRYDAPQWTLNKWYHLAVVRSGSTCKMYVDGVEVTVTTVVAWNSPVSLGSPHYIGYTTTPAYNNGNIKDLMIFKGKALSVDQLAAIMNETFIY